MTDRAGYQHLYKTKRWQRLRAHQLAKHPYCQCPHHVDCKVPAVVVDHKKPHRGDARLFFDPNNLQSMTKSCHDSVKQKFEKSGYWPGCDVLGMPVDPHHPWNN